MLQNPDKSALPIQTEKSGWAGHTKRQFPTVSSVQETCNSEMPLMTASCGQGVGMGYFQEAQKPNLKGNSVHSWRWAKAKGK